MLALAVHSLFLKGSGEGMTFYLKPDFSKIDGSVIVGAMNQAFFTLSTGMGGMAIFGSYIGKEHSLMGEAIHVITLDTLVAFLAGVIIFPACFTFDLEVNAGPSLLFDTMAAVFNNMSGGRIWGFLFFRLVPSKRQRGLRHRCLSSGTYHSPWFQRFPLPAICRRNYLA